ncbi:MAG TPA: 30S ribosomal protein S2 [Bellilinea sp.]
MASIISMKALLESGVHFGHRTNKWNPAMRPFIFTERNGIHIIDLQQTVKSLTQAYQMVAKVVADGGTVLFVGTKRQAQETIKEEATRCGMPYVTERWLPGTLTNWVTIFDRIQEMERLEKMHVTGEIDRITKKEALLIDREISRLNIRLNGIRTMKRLPELVFIVDVMREDTAVRESNSKEIPVIALVDTNCAPGGVDYVIPSNDDAIRAIKLLVGKIADAVLEGKAMRKDEMQESEAGEAVSPSTPAARVPRRQMLEEEVDDESLLGASTLAKLSPKVEAVEETPAAELAEVVEEAAAPAIAEVVEEEAAPEVAEVVEETPAPVAAKPAKKAAAAVTEVVEETPAPAAVKPAKKAAAKKAAAVIEETAAPETTEAAEDEKAAE